MHTPAPLRGGMHTPAALGEEGCTHLRRSWRRRADSDPLPPPYLSPTPHPVRDCYVHLGLAKQNLA
jgi:hypothetical protein